MADFVNFRETLAKKILLDKNSLSRNFKGLTLKSFNQDRFCHHLNITKSKLPFISLLAGNDFVEHTTNQSMGKTIFKYLQYEPDVLNRKLNIERKIPVERIQFVRSFYNVKREFTIGYTCKNYDEEEFLSNESMQKHKNFSRIPKAMWRFYFKGSGCHQGVLAQMYLKTSLGSEKIEDINHDSWSWYLQTKVFQILSHLPYEKFEDIPTDVTFYRRIPEKTKWELVTRRVKET